jgi:hypothetical protein
VVKIVNEINRKTRKEEKLTLPLHRIKNKENACLSDRSKTPSAQRSLRFKMNICLENNPSLTPLAESSQNEEKFFRKSSDTSTLSWKTKHTSSVQLEDDFDPLFHKQPPSGSTQSMLATLEQTKKRLYQQIYALDKKLLSSYEDKELTAIDSKASKKPVVISLRRKEVRNNKT